MSAPLGDPRGLAHPFAPKVAGVPVERREIDHGARGTEQTVEIMRRLAMDAGHSEGVRLLAERIVGGLAPKDYLSELRALFEWVRSNVRYTLDPRGCEWVQNPTHLLFVSGTGDCDDMATALVALAVSVGHGAAFRCIKADPTRPNEYSHVYVLLGYRDAEGVHWYAADPTQAGVPFGWEPPGDHPHKDWTVVDP